MKRDTCPYCRERVASHAPNISLQQVIDGFVERQQTLARGEVLPELIQGQQAVAAAKKAAHHPAPSRPPTHHPSAAVSADADAGGTHLSSAVEEAGRYAEQYRAFSMRSRVMSNQLCDARKVTAAPPSRFHVLRPIARDGRTASSGEIGKRAAELSYRAAQKAADAVVLALRSQLPAPISLHSQEGAALRERRRTAGAVLSHLQREEAAATERLEAARLELEVIHTQLAEQSEKVEQVEWRTMEELAHPLTPPLTPHRGPHSRPRPRRSSASRRRWRGWRSSSGRRTAPSKPNGRRRCCSCATLPPSWPTSSSASLSTSRGLRLELWFASRFGQW